MKAKHIFYGVSALLLLSACQKLTDLSSPKNELTTDKVFTDTNSAKSALFNCYMQLERTQSPQGNKFLATYADETISANLTDWNQSRIPPNENSNQTNWSEFYSVIYQCNTIQQQLQSAVKLPAAFKTQIAAEASFIRAYCYFNLVNRYGRIPLLLGTDVNETRIAVQTDSATVYQQILTDLTTAKNNLSTGYPGAGKIRANKAGATALLARVYLYQQNWSMAEQLATELIGSGTYSPLDAPANTFKTTSKESILQLATQTGFIAEAIAVVPTSTTSVPQYHFSTEFYNSFENTDLRKITWIGTNTVATGATAGTYRYPAKYKNRTANTSSPENLIILRLAEQYLIRAEARAWQGKLTGTGGATEDINTLRARAALLPVNPTGFDQVLQAIYLERRHEMFFENSDRFFDLKRTGRLQAVMTLLKPTWKSTSQFLPIPQNEITFNSNLVQNEGY